MPLAGTDLQQPMHQAVKAYSEMTRDYQVGSGRSGSFPAVANIRSQGFHS